MHTWSPRALGSMTEEGAQEASGYWFSEGLTDFLTHRTLLRSGIWSLEEFVDAVNGELMAYATSPYRTAPNSVVVEKFWTDQAVQKLPYRRGMLLALYWDYRLRQATGGRRDLDDVLQAQATRVGGMRERGENPVAPSLFAEVYRETGGPDLAADYARLAIGGGAVLLPERLFGDCARIETIHRAKFHRGWDAEATTANGNIVTGLREDSPAFRSGLRNGMQIVKREFGEVGNSTVEYGLRVKAADGTETVYRFMPTAPGTETIQKIVLTPGMSAARKAACVRSMSGA
jgi:predicted metalloprotease with PDZ domain